MDSSAKDIQLRELKDTVSQLKTMISEQTELIKSLRLIIDEKSSHEKALQEQVDYLTKKLFGSSSEKRSDDIPGQQNLFDEAEMEQDPSLPEEETVISSVCSDTIVFSCDTVSFSSRSWISFALEAIVSLLGFDTFIVPETKLLLKGNGS